MFNEVLFSPEYKIKFQELLESIKDVKGDVIEIGCWEGQSTHNIANIIYPEILNCVDTWLGNVEESKTTGIKHPTEIILETRDVFDIFKNNMNSLTKGNYIIHKMDCIEWLKSYKGEVKFCYIDASHDYKSVRDTIELILPKMVKNGILCGDDFLTANKDRYDLEGGVEKAVLEFFPNVFTFDNLWYWKNEI